MNGYLNLLLTASVIMHIVLNQSEAPHNSLELFKSITSRTSRANRTKVTLLTHLTTQWHCDSFRARV